MKRLDLEGVMLEVHQTITGVPLEDIEDIPAEAMFFYMSIRYESLVTPLIHRDMMTNGLNFKQCALKYAVGKTFCYRIGCRLGLYPKRNKSRKRKA